MSSCGAFVDVAKLKQWGGGLEHHVQLSVIVPFDSFEPKATGSISFGGTEVTAVESCWNALAGSEAISSGSLSFQLPASAPSAADDVQIGCIVTASAPVDSEEVALSIGHVPCASAPPPPPTAFSPCADVILRVREDPQQHDAPPLAHVAVAHWERKRVIRLDFGSSEVQLDEVQANRVRQHTVGGGVFDFTLGKADRRASASLEALSSSSVPGRTAPWLPSRLWAPVCHSRPRPRMSSVRPSRTDDSSEAPIRPSHACHRSLAGRGRSQSLASEHMRHHARYDSRGYRHRPP